MTKRTPKSHRTGNEVVREDGRIEYEYSDGAWRFSNGHMARQHPKAMTYDSVTGSEAAESMHAKVREARLQALVSGAKQLDPGIRTVPEAAAMMTNSQFELATSPDMGHASTQAAKYLDKTLSLVQEESKEQHNSLTIVMTDTNAIDTLKRIADKAIGHSD